MDRVLALDPTKSGVQLSIKSTLGNTYPISPGDSICVSGVCLTVTRRETGQLTFDVVTETLNCSTLGNLGPGDMVNLERSMTSGSTIDGHFVQGHVEGVGTVIDITDLADNRRLTIKPPSELIPHIIPKGSIAIDGVSMTVAGLDKTSFQVAIIPTTFSETTLGSARRDTAVNLETDMLSRAVVHSLRRFTIAPSTVTLESLRHAGFVD
ncbi:MAG: riboflavin synthase [Phycisphaeraceae bacterium]|nr:riboflavin synthase [Phycisphaeraceae bacterium]